MPTTSCLIGDPARRNRSDDYADRLCLSGPSGQRNGDWRDNQLSSPPEQDVLSSSGRYDALQLLAKKCPNGYRTIREGETARINQTIDRAWNGQIPSEKLWTIQFECK